MDSSAVTMSCTAMFSFLSALLLLTSSIAYAQDFEGKVKELRLDNGMTWLLLERHQAPVFAGVILVRVGGADENAGESGMAHLNEHMAFKGTKIIGTANYKKEHKLLDKIDRVAIALDNENARPAQRNETLIKELAAELQALQEEHKQYVKKDELSQIYDEEGGVGLNAWTSKDLTNYHVNLPANKLELWMLLEADRLANPVFREFYSERDVVMEERRMRYENDPDGRLYELYNATAFVAHPYAFPTIGWTSDIAQLNVAKMKRFHATYYVPANMTGCLVGDFNVQEAEQLIRKYFGKRTAAPRPPEVITREPAMTGERTVSIEFDANPQLMLGYHKPGFTDSSHYAFEVLEMLLGYGRTSRLYRALVLEQKLASDVSVWIGPGQRYSNLLNINAVPLAGHTNQEIVAAIDAEIKKLQNELVQPVELQKIINQIEASFIEQMNSNMGMAAQLTTAQLVYNDWRYLDRYRGNITRVTPAAIQDICRRYLVKENRTIAFLEKKAGAQ
jgi:predicted Zn-dependent peptidase